MSDLATNIHSKPGYPKGLRPKSNKPSVKFGDHLRVKSVAAAVPVADPSLALLNNIVFNMDGNGPDSRFGPDFPGAGDCVTAEADHALSIIDYLLTGIYTPWTVAQIKAFYATQNPKFTWDTNSKTGSGSAADGGMDIQESMETLVSMGLLVGFAEVDLTNANEVALAQYLGLALWCGVELYDIQMDEFNDNKSWTYVKTSPDDGGHGVPYTWADQLVTWGKLQAVTASFNKHQRTQCFFGLTQAHINNPAFRANYDLASFAAAVSDISNGKIVVPTQPTPIVAPPAASNIINITDSDVWSRIVKTAGSNGVDVWSNKHFESYFKVK